MAKHKQPVGMKPGIYFNMPIEAYHNDPALSHSGMVKLLLSPLDYWISGPLNPNRETWRLPERGSGKWKGDLSHTLLLERERFWRTYKVYGMSGKGDFKWLTPDEYREIKSAVDEIRNIPAASAYFEHGYPEVSIFWRCKATGLMCRIRVDYLRTFGGIDYKKARSLINNQLGWQIRDFGYHLQEKLYIEGITEIKQLLREGKAVIEGNVDKAWLKEFMRDEQVDFCFFFQRSEPPHIFRIVSFDREIKDDAQIGIDEAKNIYKSYIEKHGPYRWPAGVPQPEEFSIFHLPKRS